MSIKAATPRTIHGLDVVLSQLSVQLPSGNRSFPQSQLATLGTNSVLMQLGRVFGTGFFTSRMVSSVLGIGYRTACQKLSRMSGRPYYLLSVITRASRTRGGFENIYTISPRGWGKIAYFNRKMIPSQDTFAGSKPPTLFSQFLSSEHLLSGLFVFELLRREDALKRQRDLALKSIQEEEYTNKREIDLLRRECDSLREKSERLEIENIRQAFKVERLKSALREQQKEHREYIAMNTHFLASLSQELQTLPTISLSERAIKYFVHGGLRTIMIANSVAHMYSMLAPKPPEPEQL